MAWGDFVIKVGEEVGVMRSHYRSGGTAYAKFGTVIKINGHGHIFVDTGDGYLRFTKRGDAYKDKYGPSLIHAEQLRVRLAEDNRRTTIAQTARKVEETIKGGWSYSGTWHVSEDRVNQLKQLVAELESFVEKTDEND